MSLRLQPSIPPVPADTSHKAHAVFRRGNPYLMLRDELGAMFGDADFAGLYPRRGQSAYAPWRLPHRIRPAGAALLGVGRG